MDFLGRSGSVGVVIRGAMGEISDARIGLSLKELGRGSGGIRALGRRVSSQ